METMAYSAIDYTEETWIPFYNERNLCFAVLEYNEALKDVIDERYNAFVIAKNNLVLK